MKSQILIITFASLVFSGLLGCSSRSVMPDKGEIKVSRKAPDSDANCTEIGKIVGTSSSAKATREQVLEDLKQTAANKGATHLVVKQFSAQGTSVTGIAYECP